MSNATVKTAAILADLEGRKEGLRSDLLVMGFSHPGRDVRVTELFQVIRKIQAMTCE